MTEPENQFDSDSIIDENKTTGFLRGAAILAAAFIFGGVFTYGISNWGKVRFVGFLRAASTSVDANQDAVIQKLLVEPNQKVEKGTPLAELSNPQLMADIEAIKQEIAALNAEKDQRVAVAARDLRQEMRNLDTDIRELRIQSADLLKQKFSHELSAVAWKDYTKEFDKWYQQSEPEQVFRSDIPDSIAPTEEARIRGLLRQQSAKNAVEVFETQIKICDDEVAAIENHREDLSAENDRVHGIDAIELRLKQAEGLLKRLEAKQSTLTLKAADYGIVGVQRCRIGDQVTTAQCVMDILKTDQPHIDVRIPTTQAAEVDRIVYLKFPGGEKRTGRIANLPPQANPMAEGETMTYLSVRILPSGKLWPENLPIGSAVTVSLTK